jgi:hypothetical protein
MSWHWADLCLRPEPTSLTPPTRRRRWLVACGGYAAFSSSPPAILIVVTPDFLSVAPHDCEGRGLERAGRDAKEGEHLALQLRELDVEDLDAVSVLKQMVPLGEAEQP